MVPETSSRLPRDRETAAGGNPHRRRFGSGVATLNESKEGGTAVAVSAFVVETDDGGGRRDLRERPAREVTRTVGVAGD